MQFSIRETQRPWYLALIILFSSLFKTGLLVPYIKLVLIFSNRMRHSLPLHPLHFIIPRFIAHCFHGLCNYDLHLSVGGIFIILTAGTKFLQNKTLGMDSVPLEMLGGRLYAEPHSYFPAKDFWYKLSPQALVGESSSTHAKGKNLLFFSWIKMRRGGGKRNQRRDEGQRGCQQDEELPEAGWDQWTARR